MMAGAFTKPSTRLQKTNGFHQLARLLAARMHRQIADAVAREREVLCVGRRGDRALVLVLWERVAEAVVDDAAVRLVADEVDVGAQFLAFAAQQCGEVGDERRRVDDAGRIVGRVEDDDPWSRGVSWRSSSFEVRGEVVAAADNDRDRAVVVGVEEVLGEVGREDDDLVARVAYGAYGDVERGRGAGGHHHVLHLRTAGRSLPRACRRRPGASPDSRRWACSGALPGAQECPRGFAARRRTRTAARRRGFRARGRRRSPPRARA